MQDLGAVLLSCKVLWGLVSNPSSELLLRLASNADSGLQPYPQTLMAVKSTDLANWVVSDECRHGELQRSIEGGCEELFQLAIRVSPLTLDDIQRLHTARRDILLPLFDELNPEYGPPSRTSDLCHFCSDVMQSLINFWIYCDVFQHNISPRYLDLPPTSPLKPLSQRIRADWWKYCVPDRNCDYDQFPEERQQSDIQHLFRKTQQEFVRALKLSLNGDRFRWPNAWAHRAFHAGLPALAFLTTTTKDYQAVPKELWEVKEMVQKKGEEGVMDAISLVDDPIWESMLWDIHLSHNAMWPWEVNVNSWE